MKIEEIRKLKDKYETVNWHVQQLCSELLKLHNTNSAMAADLAEATRELQELKEEKSAHALALDALFNGRCVK